MRFANFLLITILCTSITPIAIADNVSWSVKTSEDSPFARLAAIKDDDEIVSIACIKSDIADATLKENHILSQMKESDSLAILVRDEPTEGKSARLELEYLNKGAVMARTQMGYVESVGAYFTPLAGTDFLYILEETTALRFRKSRPNEQFTEVDFSEEFRSNLSSMAVDHCHPGVASAFGLAETGAQGGSIAETIDWQEASGWVSKKGDLLLLRRGSENGFVTQLADGSGKAEATLFTLEKTKSLSPYHDFFIDAGNRYFFRAGHNTNGRALASMTEKGDLSLLNTEASFARSLKDAVAMGDGWILAAGGLFHLSAGDELSNLSTTPASGSFPAHLISLGDRVIYVDMHPEYGAELFATDGTVKGTGMLLDINDRVYTEGRTRGSSPALEHAARINNRVVFSATDSSIPIGSHGNFHIWSSDGTAEGTRRLPTDGFYSEFSNFIEFQGRLYVTARPRGHGEEVLFSTDGTPEGTRALASTHSLVKAAGGDPEKSRAFLGEPTKVGNRLIVPLLGSPLGLDRGNPMFEISPNGDLKQLSVTSESIGDVSSRLRQTGLSAGGKLLYTGTAVKESTTFEGKVTSTVLRSVDPDSGETKILYELHPAEKFAWLPNVPQRLPNLDAVVFLTQFSSGKNQNLIVTDGTGAGTRALSQVAEQGQLPNINMFIFSDRHIAWIEHDIFFSYDPSQGEVITLFDPLTTRQPSRPGNAVIGPVRLR